MFQQSCPSMFSHVLACPSMPSKVPGTSATVLSDSEAVCGGGVMLYARPLLGANRLLHERFQGHGRQAERVTPHQTGAIRRRGRVVCLCQGCEARAFGLGE
jgi:hypothetical protein